MPYTVHSSSFITHHIRKLLLLLCIMFCCQCWHNSAGISALFFRILCIHHPHPVVHYRNVVSSNDFLCLWQFYLPINTTNVIKTDPARYIKPSHSTAGFLNLIGSGGCDSFCQTAFLTTVKANPRFMVINVLIRKRDCFCNIATNYKNLYRRWSTYDLSIRWYLLWRNVDFISIYFQRQS